MVALGPDGPEIAPIRVIDCNKNTALFVYYPGRNTVALSAGQLFLRDQQTENKLLLEIIQLTKSFGSYQAVDHISFSVRQGEIFGFLGPNGAGKTTTINMICSLLKPDSGQIRINGVDVVNSSPSWRKQLGVVPQETALYDELSASENLKFWGKLYGLSGKALQDRVDAMLHITGLTDRSKERIKSFSGGMKRRLNLAVGMIHQPALLLLDEPTVGIDPQGRHSMLEMVREQARSGATILYTTHYLDEAELLCDRLAIIDHGRILACGAKTEINQIVGENRLVRVTGGFTADATLALVQQMGNISILSQQPEEVVFSLPMQMGTGILIEKMLAHGFRIDNLSIKEPSLDSVFLKLTGRELRD